MNSFVKFIVKVVVISFITYAGVNNKDIMDLSKALCIGLIASVILSVLSNIPIYSEGYQNKVSKNVKKDVEKDKKKALVKSAKDKAKSAIKVAKNAIAKVKKAKKEVKKVTTKTAGKAPVKKTVKAAKTKKGVVAKTEKTPPTKVKIPIAKIPKKANKGKFPVVTKPRVSKLSMQEQKITDAVQIQKLKASLKGKKKRFNKDYGYSFLEPSLWNQPLADRRTCVVQRECPVCPQSSIGTGSFLQIKGAKQLPPEPKKSQVA